MAALILADISLVGNELAAPDVVLAGAKEDWDAFEKLTRDAFARYPELHSTGVHGGDIDPRAMQLLATLTYVQKAGFYSASELLALAERGGAERAWVAREALRLRALVVALRQLVAALDDGTVSHSGYASAVEALARRFAQMRVADVTPPRTSGG
jgi:hypothetical protein